MDVVSGVEREIGKKDDGKLRSFIDAVRCTDTVEIAQREPRSGGSEVSPGREPRVR